jgi:hypothetical protein
MPHIHNTKLMNNLSNDRIREVFRIFRSWKTYFDFFSEKFDETNMEEKVNTLSLLVLFDVNLEKLLREYKDYYSEDSSVLGSLNKTLAHLWSYAETGKSGDYAFVSKYETADEKTLLEGLTACLKKSIKYSLDDYIRSYLRMKKQGDEVDYIQLKKFFKFDLDKMPEFIEERDEEEGLNSFQSYRLLFNFLHRDLIPYYLANDSRNLYPQMGMAMSAEALIRKHIPQETYDLILNDNQKREEVLYKLIKEVIEIVFLHKAFNLKSADFQKVNKII